MRQKTFFLVFEGLPYGEKEKFVKNLGRKLQEMVKNIEILLKTTSTEGLLSDELQQLRHPNFGRQI